MAIKAAWKKLYSKASQYQRSEPIKQVSEKEGDLLEFGEGSETICGESGTLAHVKKRQGRLGDLSDQRQAMIVHVDASTETQHLQVCQFGWNRETSLASNRMSLIKLTKNI